MSSALLVAILSIVPAALQDAQVTVVDHPPTDVRTPHYATNRPPLRATPFATLPIDAFEPRGWLGEQLRLQAEGFHGRLGELSRFLEKEGNAWLATDGAGTHGWEEPVYWLKGFGACAYTAPRTQRMLDEARAVGRGHPREPEGGRLVRSGQGDRGGCGDAPARAAMTSGRT